VSLRTIGVRLRLETGQYKRDAGEAAAATDKLGKKISDTGTKSKADLDKISTGMALVGGALLGIAGAAVATAAKFDKQMSEVSAVTGATADSMEELRAAAIQAGQATVFSAGEAAKAEAELAKAGISTADILGGALRGALDLASAGSLDLAEAATIAANAMNTFGLSGGDVSHIADVLAAAANKSAADVHDLGLGLQQVGLVANQVGFSLEETVGLLAAFADRGLRGSDGATSLKTALQRLAAPTDKAAELMQDLGISMYDSSGQMVGAADIAGQLQDALKDLTPAQRNAALQTMFGSDAIRAANILYTEGARGVSDYINAVNDQGAASDMASEKLNNLAGDLEQLRGSLETFAINAGSGAGGGLRPVVQSVTNLVNALGNVPAPVQTAGVALAGLTGATLLAGSAWLKLKDIIGPALENLAKTGPVGARAAGALGRVGAAVGRLGVALTAMQVASAAFGDKPLDTRVEAMSDSLAEFARTGEKSGEAARVLGDDFNHLAYDLQSLDSGFWADLGNGIAGTVEGLTGLGSVMDESLQHAKERLDAIDAGLANLVSTGRPALAAEAFNRLADEAARHGITVQELTAGLPQYAAAMDNAAHKTADAGKASSDTAAKTKVLEETLDETTAAADGLTDAWQRMHGATLSADESLLAAKKAIDDVGESFKANEGKIKGNSVAALENRVAMGKAAEAAATAAQKYFDLTGDLEGAQKIMDDQRKAADKAAIANGGNAKQVHDLSQELFKLPKTVSTAVKLTGVSAALNSYYSMRGIISRTITVPIATVQTGPIASARRWGGITRHAADGVLSAAQVYSPAAPARYAFAEPQTGGEAFVPKRGNYGRSMSILHAAAGWYNADVVPRDGWYGSAGGSSGGQVNVVLPPGGTPFERALVEVLRGLSWTVGGGSAQKSYGRGR
jgi:TP901 family phage tail tape measure protein